MKIESIEEGREEISRIDAEIIRLISERTNAAERIGLVKKELGVPIRDSETERKVLERYRILATRYNLPNDRIESIAKLLIETAVEREESSQNDNRGF